MTLEKITQYRLVSSAAFLSGLVALDFLFSFFCSGFPLLFYLMTGGLGYGLGSFFLHRFSGTGRGVRFVRIVGICLAAFTVVGMFVHTVRPVSWDTKCSWRYCGRALSPGLLKSPYPVGTPTCRGWWVCANEYTFAPGEYQTALLKMKRQGCAEP